MIESNKTVDGKDVDNVLILIETYLPGIKAGGPVQSVGNLAEALGDEITFKVLTCDRDIGDVAPYPSANREQWNRVGKVDVWYVRPNVRGLIRIIRQLLALDKNTVLYLQSFLSRRYSMLPMLLFWTGMYHPRSIIMSPRGEFSPGALAIHPRRKKIYISIFRKLGLHRRVIWAASTEIEECDIRREFDRDGKMNCKIMLACDIPAASIPDIPRTRKKRAGELRIVLISRVSRKKNIDTAIRLLQGIPGKVVFNIVGPIEDQTYWEECQKEISALPKSAAVNYLGYATHEEVLEHFASHDLMFFPTHGENYGHVIFEALAMGCPVLISDQTPWRNLEAAGVGWDISLNHPERFREALQRCVDADDEWLRLMSERAKQFACARSSDVGLLDSYRALFRAVL